MLKPKKSAPPTTPGSSKGSDRTRGEPHSSPATFSSKRLRHVDDDQGPSSSPSKRRRDGKPQEPAIKSRVIPAADQSATEVSLPDDKKVAYRALEEYYNTTKLAQENAPNAATRKRAADKLPNIIAAMAALYGPWDPQRWETLSDKFGRMLKFTTVLLAGATDGLVPACEFIIISRYYPYSRTDQKQGKQCACELKIPVRRGEIMTQSGRKNVSGPGTTIYALLRVVPPHRPATSSPIPSKGTRGQISGPV